MDPNAIARNLDETWKESSKLSVGLYKKMVEEVEDYAIILLDVNGTIIDWNPGAEKIKGYSEAEILGKNFATK